MGLEGQHGERGYAMAALLVSLAVMSVLMSAVLPAWRHQAQREKEAELVFRGEQYVRAIRLFEAKMGPGTRPPNFDILVQQKFLRKKYKDPMTASGEFQPLYAGANLQAPGNPGAGGRGVAIGGGGVQRPPMQQPSTSIGAQMGGGGILGVASKSTETSIRIYRGGTHYNEWQFVYASASSAPGGRGAPTPGFPGGQRGPGQGPGGGLRRGGPGSGIGAPGQGPAGPGQRPGGPRGLPPGGIRQ